VRLVVDQGNACHDLTPKKMRHRVHRVHRDHRDSASSSLVLTSLKPIAIEEFSL
jgi:hypothetical protein